MIRITGEPLSPQDLLNLVKTEDSGSLVMHVAVVKPVSEGREVVGIEFKISKTDAERELSQLATRICTQWEVEDIALCRRAGPLNFGEVILIAAVSSARHKPAFEACQFAVEQMKKMKSVIKKEIFLEPSEERKEAGSAGSR